MGYKTFKKDLKEARKDVENLHERKWGPIIMAIIFLIIGLGIGCWLCSGFFECPLIGLKQKAEVFEDKEKNSDISKEDKSSTSCPNKDFKENIKNWTINHYSGFDEDGFYCPHRYSGFDSPDIWYNETIPVLFDSIEIKYQAKNKSNPINDPATFIFSAGESPRIFRFYITETNPQVIGFEKITIDDPKQKLKREEGKILEDPIQPGTEVILRVETTKKPDNEIMFHFALEYISAVTKKSLENSFSYSIHVPSPSSENFKIKIGFGTLKGDCIKPISYKICY